MARSDSDYYESPELARAKAREALVPRALKPKASGKTRLSLFMRQFFRRGLPMTTVILAIVSFGWPLFSKTEVSFTLSKDQVTESDGRVLMRDLQFTGVDKQDRLFVVNAKQGEQEDPSAKRIRLRDIDAEIDLAQEGDLTLVARSGLYRLEEEQLALTGDVKLKSARGLSLSMGGVEIDLKTKTAQGEGRVEGKSSLGRIQSERMSVNLNEGVGQFTGSVRLTITPKPQPGNQSGSAINATPSREKGR